MATDEQIEVPFTQYLMPDGRARAASIMVGASVGAKARELIADGLSFECEVLTTGEVSVTITDHVEGMDLDIRVIPNGPGVREAVEDMIRTFERHAEALLSDAPMVSK